VLLPFAIAAGLAYILIPLQDRLRSRLRLRGVFPVIVIYLLFLALLAGSIFWAQSVLVPQAIDLAHRAPTLVHNAIQQFFHSENVQLFGHQTTATDLSNELMSNAVQRFSTPQSALALIMHSFELLIGSVLTLVLLFYFLLDSQRILRGLLWLTPPRHRPFVYTLAQKSHPVLLAYVRGLFIVVAYASVVTWIGTGLIFHWPNAPLLSIMTGILELIPVLGPILSASILGIVAIDQGNVWIAIGFAIFALFLRLSIDQLIGPLVLGRAVRLHPVVVIFCFFTGGILFGALGVLLAIPTAAVIKLAVKLRYAEPSLHANDQLA